MKPWKTVAIVGMGLMGGSIGLALRRRRLARQVIGIGRRPATLRIAKQVGAVTATTTDLAKGVAEAELVVVCTPVDSVVTHVRAAAAACPEGTLITDVGSTKARIVAELEKAHESDPAWRTGVHYLGSHPLAGNHRQGPKHATADLFAGRVVIVTPTKSTRAGDLRAIRRLWTSLGAKVVEMTAYDHDRAVAAISHLPHVAASAVAATTPNEYVTLAAGGWLDTTRIAAADPALWREILLANRSNVLAAIERFEASFAALRAALNAGDAETLEKLLSEAKQIRDAVGS